MEVLSIMVKNNNPKILISGPLWILQLWLNAMFNDHLVSSHPEDLAILTYGTKLCYLCYKTNWGKNDEKNFLYFFEIFHGLSADATRIHFSPFVEREIGPAWFTKPIDHADPGDISIWSHYLCQTMLLAGLPGKKDAQVYTCLPNAVSR